MSARGSLAAIALVIVALLAFGQPAPASVSTSLLPSATIRVMPLGDSITYGLYSSTGDGYRRDLWNRLRAVGVPADFVGSVKSGRMADNNHEGHNGWRVDQIAAHIEEWTATYKPDVVLLHIGTNDVAHNYKIPTVAARLSALIDRILALRPGVRIFVATLVYLRNPGDRYYEYNAAIPGIVASKGPNVRLVRQDVVGKQAGDLHDRAHPTDCGYAKMAYVWYQALGRSSLNKKGRPWPAGYNPFAARTGVCAP